MIAAAQVVGCFHMTQLVSLRQLFQCQFVVLRHTVTIDMLHGKIKEPLSNISVRKFLPYLGHIHIVVTS